MKLAYKSPQSHKPKNFITNDAWPSHRLLTSIHFISFHFTNNNSTQLITILLFPFCLLDIRDRFHFCVCFFFVSNSAYDRFQRCICWMDGIQNIIIDSMENVLCSIELFDLNKVLCIYLYCFYCSSHVKINFRNGFYFLFIREWRQGYNFPARYSLKCARRPAVQIQMFQIKQTFIRFFFQVF